MHSYFPKEIQTKFYICCNIWDLVPEEIKQLATLNKFKAKIKIWKLEYCPYRLSRTYLPLIGFITDYCGSIKSKG